MEFTFPYKMNDESVLYSLHKIGLLCVYISHASVVCKRNDNFHWGIHMMFANHRESKEIFTIFLQWRKPDYNFIAYP